MPESSRFDQLLRNVTTELSNYRDPFHISFLVENHVTLDECGALYERMSVILRSYLQASQETQEGQT
jgi:hypothetical protein